MTTARVGDIVRYGFRIGRVIRLERENGQDGAYIWPETLGPGDGYRPHWVPLSGLTVLREKHTGLIHSVDGAAVVTSQVRGENEAGKR